MSLVEVNRGLWSYRGYWIQYDPKPIPHRGFDYSWEHHDFDGAPWGETGGPPMDTRYGTSSTLQDALEDIDENIEDGRGE